jgi:hypothetical protein
MTVRTIEMLAKMLLGLEARTMTIMTYCPPRSKNPSTSKRLNNLDAMAAESSRQIRRI